VSNIDQKRIFRGGDGNLMIIARLTFVLPKTMQINKRYAFPADVCVNMNGTRRFPGLKFPKKSFILFLNLP